MRWLRSCWRRIRAQPQSIRIRWIAAAIARSGKFDRQWYLTKYPDVAACGVDPLVHYLLHGAKEGREPSPSFSTRKYLKQNLDVATGSMNPFWHFLSNENSNVNRVVSSELFDVEFYVKENPDVRKSGLDPAVHYFRHGGEEGRDPSPLFDTEWYWWQNPNTRRPGINPLLHFLRRSGRRKQSSKKPKSRSIASAAAARRRAQALGSGTASPPLNIVFVNHGSFNNNSAGHIAGFADALVKRGHNVVVCARGNPERANDFRLPQFRVLSRAELMRDPQVLRDLFAGTFHSAPSLIHCWTTRENVRAAVAPAIEMLQIPYFVHFEDNEEFVTRAELALDTEGAVPASELECERLPGAFSHPLRAPGFASAATGITVIIDALRRFCPSAIPNHLLKPGLDLALLSSPINEMDRLRLCRKFNAPLAACIISYTGNLHRANARDMHELYAAIQELNGRGINAHLIRTGSNSPNKFEDELNRLCERHVTELGLVDRSTLVEVFRLADVFVQPGRPGEFDDYRLPSKLPDWLASGRPVILPATNVALQLRDGVDCLLLHRGDRMEIADRVTTLVRDKALAHRLANNSRQFALENFSWDRSVEGLEAFYRDTLKRCGV